MAQQIINTGSAPNDGLGDTLRNSFIKTNDNFTELYARPIGGSTIAPSTEIVFGTGTGVSSSPELIYDAATMSLSVNSSSTILDGSAIVLATAVHSLDSFGNEMGKASLSLAQLGGGIYMAAGTAGDSFNAGSVSMYAGGSFDGNSGDFNIYAGSIDQNSTALSNQAGFVRIGAGSFDIDLGEGAEPDPLRSGRIEFYCGSKRILRIEPLGGFAFGQSGAGSVGSILMSNDYSGTPEWVSIPKPLPFETLNIDNSTLSFGFDGTGFGSGANHNMHVRLKTTSNVTFRIEADSYFPNTQPWWAADSDSPMEIGGTILFSKNGTGNVIIQAAPGVTINTPSTLIISALNGKASLTKVGPNEWDIEGRLAAV